MGYISLICVSFLPALIRGVSRANQHFSFLIHVCSVGKEGRGVLLKQRQIRKQETLPQRARGPWASHPVSGSQFSSLKREGWTSDL